MKHFRARVILIANEYTRAAACTGEPRRALTKLTQNVKVIIYPIERRAAQSESIKANSEKGSAP